MFLNKYVDTSIITENMILPIVKKRQKVHNGKHDGWSSLSYF